MRIALVHDWLTHLGGAERVLIALHQIFPEAPVYTLFYDKKFTAQYLPGAKINPSFLQRIPNIKKVYPWFKLLMPSAIESLDFSKADLVISSSHEFSHGVLVKPRTKHICFYHSPSRILWDRAHEYVDDFKERGRGRLKLSLIKLGQHFLRLWDRSASQRPDIMIANSKHVAARIKKYYNREAIVIYPPVKLRFKKNPQGIAIKEHLESESRFAAGESRIPTSESGQQGKSRLFKARAKRGQVLTLRARKMSEQTSLGFANVSEMAVPERFFLIVSQLYPHKNIDLAIEAFKKLPELNLMIVGEGPEKKRLEKLIGDSQNIKLLGFVPDGELPKYYQNCSAYLISNEEDFGISPIEAMSFGKPVLAFREGGAKETVLEGITGEFFEKLEPEHLAEKIRAVQKKAKENYFNPAVIRKHSEKFSQSRFKKKFFDIIKSLGYDKKVDEKAAL